MTATNAFDAASTMYLKSMDKAIQQMGSKLREHCNVTKEKTRIAYMRWYSESDPVENRGYATPTEANFPNRYNTVPVPLDELEDWERNKTTDITRDNMVNRNTVITQTLIHGFNRKFDGKIIKAADAEHTDIGNQSGIDADESGLREILTHANANDWGMDKVLVVNARTFSNLLSVDKVSSSDYGKGNPFYNGRPSFETLGFTVIHCNELDKASNVTQITGKNLAYAWDKRAMGVAIGNDPVTRLDFDGYTSMWKHYAYFTMGAKTLQPKGVGKVVFNN